MQLLHATTFTLKDKIPGVYSLDLGEVCYVAEVMVNGKSAGKRIWMPYIFNITDYLQPGENNLEIKVEVSDYNVKVRQEQDGNHNTTFPKEALMANDLLGPVQIMKEIPAN